MIYTRQLFKEGLKVAKSDIINSYLGKYIPLDPITINLLVNNNCNSRCQMCHVWKKKKRKGITPLELERILRDPLFNNIKHIGVSGGEPTLRDDLPELFRVIVHKKPKILGTSIITNAIQSDTVISKLEEIVMLCSEREVNFQIMVSLDGIGAIHDKVRGVEGNFENAIKVLKYFNKKGVHIQFGCTITKDNVWNIDDVFEFAKKENLRGKFRVAEFIDRLDNKSEIEIIRNFSDYEKYHLGLFFEKLKKEEKHNTPKKRVYNNISNMLLGNHSRISKCHWQSKGVTLDCEGNLYYCAPHSKKIGNTKNTSAQKLYGKNIAIRRKIIREYCADCIHDYGGELSYNEWKEISSEKYWQNEFSIENQFKNVISERVEVVTKKSKFKNILIIGWYGSETAGDKAILSEIIRKITIDYIDPSIVLASINPNYTKWTLKELNIKNVQVIPTYSSEFFKGIKKSDSVVMGGGPLMHINALGFVHAAFLEAKRLKKHIKIESCGIGPINKNEKFKKILQSILLLSNEIKLRDYNSVREAELLSNRIDIIKTCDPAVNYVLRWKKNKRVNPKKYLNLYLREWTPEYNISFSRKEFLSKKDSFMIELAKWIDKICEHHQIRPRLLPMHHYHHGRDDRVFNRYFAKEYISHLNPIVENKPIPLDDILKSMNEAFFSICMRFHSVLFANELNIPFCAIDYTSGGKIFSYLKDNGKLQNIISLIDVADGQWRKGDMNGKNFIRRNKIANYNNQ